jgi:hypothetical protein
MTWFNDYPTFRWKIHCYVDMCYMSWWFCLGHAWLCLLSVLGSWRICCDKLYAALSKYWSTRIIRLSVRRHISSYINTLQLLHNLLFILTSVLSSLEQYNSSVFTAMSRNLLPYGFRGHSTSGTVTKTWELTVLLEGHSQQFERITFPPLKHGFVKVWIFLGSHGACKD